MRNAKYRALAERPLEPEQYDFRAAFARDTLSFAQELQFIPNVRGAVDTNQFPSAWHVGAQLGVNLILFIIHEIAFRV